MSKTIVLVGSLDTKGQEFSFVKNLIEKEGLQTLTVDFGVMGAPEFKPEISRETVVSAGGGSLADLATGDHKDAAMKVMADGLAQIVSGLYAQGKLDGILGMGGSGGTSIATTAMRALPVGVPKLMVSTIGGGDVSAYAGTKDISFMPSVVDVAGLNRISRAVFANAAGAISGMVKSDIPMTQDDRPLIAASMFGNTTIAVDHARELLDRRGYETLIFHSTGVGGKTMEGLIDEGYMVGVLDITTTELADYVCGGVFDAGADRCTAASRAKIPVVMVPGCVDMANFASVASMPEKYHGRKLYQWNPNVTLLRTNSEENIRIGKMIAAAANASPAPVAIILPLKGVSMLDSEGGEFWDPEADQACFAAIKANLNPGIPVLEMNNNINDPEFAEKVTDTLLEMIAN